MAYRDDRVESVRGVVEDILAVTVAETNPARALAQVRAQCMMRLEQVSSGQIREITYRDTQERVYASHIR